MREIPKVVEGMPTPIKEVVKNGYDL